MKFKTMFPNGNLGKKRVKPTIGISFFGSKTRITQPIAPKICTKNDSYVLQLRDKFQVSIFSRFKVIAFFIFVYEFVIF